MQTEHLWQSQLTLRIDWSEMDLYGHVNNVSYFKYIQAARVHFWDRMGLGSFEKGGIGPILASTQCLFKAALHYPGTVHIQTRCPYIKNSSWGLEHHLLNEFGALCAEAQDAVVLYDFSKEEKVPIPDTMRGILEEMRMDR